MKCLLFFSNHSNTIDNEIVPLTALHQRGLRVKPHLWKEIGLVFLSVHLVYFGPSLSNQPTLVHLVLFSLFGPLQSIRSIQSTFVYSVHFNLFGWLRSIKSTLVQYSPLWFIFVYLVHFSPLGLLWSINSNSIYFGPLQSIWFISVHSAHFCPFRSTSIHSSYFSPFLLTCEAHLAISKLFNMVEIYL